MSGFLGGAYTGQGKATNYDEGKGQSGLSATKQPDQPQGLFSSTVGPGSYSWAYSSTGGGSGTQSVQTFGADSTGHSAGQQITSTEGNISERAFSDGRELGTTHLAPGEFRTERLGQGEVSAGGSLPSAGPTALQAARTSGLDQKTKDNLSNQGPASSW
jgi:hypothetical protein